MVPWLGLQYMILYSWSYSLTFCLLSCVSSSCYHEFGLSFWYLWLRPTLAINGCWFKLCWMSRNKVQSYLKSDIFGSDQPSLSLVIGSNSVEDQETRFNRISNLDYSWSWKLSWIHLYPVITKRVSLRWTHHNLYFCVPHHPKSGTPIFFVWFDSLRPINNLSFK